MNVLLVQGGAERGGGERMLLALARHLPQFGVAPTVAFLQDGPFVAEVVAAGIDTVVLDVMARLREPHKLPLIVRAIAAVARERDSDLIQGNGEKMAVLAAHAGRRVRRPAVAWLHDAPMRSAASTATQGLLRFGPAATFVACSQWTADEFERRWRLPVRCIANGIEMPDGVTPVDPRGIAGWEPDTFVVSHVARLQRWKGADVFLHAAGQIAAVHPQARFLVVGDALYGWEREYASSLPRLAAHLGISDRVHFAGHRDDAVALMAGSDVVVHSSVRPEPFGLVVVEAMACGRAVIASASGGSASLVQPGVSGFVAPPGDAAAIASLVDELLSDRALRDRIGQTARTVARRYFSATTMAGQFALLYDELVLARHGQGALR